MSLPFDLTEGLNIYKLTIGLELEKDDYFYQRKTEN